MTHVVWALGDFFDFFFFVFFDTNYCFVAKKNSIENRLCLLQEWDDGIPVVKYNVIQVLTSLR